MDQAIASAIKAHYGFADFEVFPAPRQFVAETYIIAVDANTAYFCKIIDKPIFIEQIIKSLPALNAIHQLKFDRVNYPIPTQSGSFHFMVDRSLVVLFNYIDAPQSYEYSLMTFGDLTGQIHRLSKKINTPMPIERFKFIYQDDFEYGYRDTIHEASDDPVIEDFRLLVRHYHDGLMRYYAHYHRLAERCRKIDFEYVITHGDAPGNVLMKSPTDIYIIDWDEILLAPPERDLWFLEDEPDFLAGYRQIYPRFRMNPVARDFSILHYYFNSLVHYLREIILPHDEAHRRHNIESLANYLDPQTSWITPSLEKLGING